MQIGFTRWLLKTNARELPLHIYETPLTNIKYQYTQNKKLVASLRWNRDWQPIGFFKQLIGSFEPIEGEDVKKSMMYVGYRPINLELFDERQLLKYVLLTTIERCQPYNDWKVEDKRKLRSRKPVAAKDSVDLYRCMQLDCDIDTDGRITVGFHLSHRLMFQKNVHEMQPGNLSKLSGKKDKIFLIHQETGQRYEFVEELDLTVSDRHPTLKQSVFDYMKMNYQEHWIKRYNIASDSRLVRTIIPGEPKQPYDHPPQVLKLECDFEVAPSELITEIKKFTVDEKMNLSIRLANSILSKCKYIKIEPEGYLAHKHGYESEILDPPELLFGNNRRVVALKDGKEQVFQGLSKYGVYGRNKEKISLPYIFVVDQRIRNHILKERDPRRKKVKQDWVQSLVKKLESLSQTAGVQLDKDLEKKMKGVVLSTKYVSHDQLKQYLNQEIKENNITDNYTVLFLTEKKSDCYDVVKKVFGSKNIATQFVGYETLEQKFFEWNVLLNMYVKNKIQPWMLANPLHSDCYIGLDVSHENGLHASGGVQIIGSNGEIIFAKSFGGNEKGEIISDSSLTDIILDSLEFFKERKGYYPKHITFHRDGAGRQDEINTIEELLNRRGIRFDYISIVKKPRLRMAARDVNKSRWETYMGQYLVKDNLAYLISTRSAKGVGMAEPIKIELAKGVTDIKTIVQDIYHLSFMNVHVVRKSRLPNTITYADRASTAYNRGFVPKDGTDKNLNV